jgi:hypothetical protein
MHCNIVICFVLFCLFFFFWLGSDFYVYTTISTKPNAGSLDQCCAGTQIEVLDPAVLDLGIKNLNWPGPIFFLNRHNFLFIEFLIVVELEKNLEFCTHPFFMDDDFEHLLLSEYQVLVHTWYWEYICVTFQSKWKTYSHFFQRLFYLIEHIVVRCFSVLQNEFEFTKHKQENMFPQH